MIRGLIIILISALTLIGCSRSDERDNHLELLQAQIDEMQAIIAEKDAAIKRLTEELAERESEDSSLDEAIREVPWLDKLNVYTEWDKVVIRRHENDPAAAIVDDPLFLESIKWLLHIKRAAIAEYPNGIQTDIEPYLYELYEGDRQYVIRVVERGVIEAGRDRWYWEVDPGIHLPGVAFMPRPPHVRHDGLIAKMAASGAVRRGDQYVMFSSFRAQSRIAPLTEGRRLEEQPEDPGEITERFTFYYYGEELVMDVYDNHVKLSDATSDEWYEYEGAGVQFTVEAG